MNDRLSTTILAMAFWFAALVPAIAKQKPPVITSSLNAKGTVGQAFTYRVKATNRPTRFGVTGLPGGLSLNKTTGLISGAPSRAGTFRVKLQATNSKGTGNANLSLNVVLPRKPTITSALNANATAGDPFKYQIKAINMPTRYWAERLPKGLSSNRKSGLISGTPSEEGNFSVVINAANSGGTGNATLTLSIKPPRPLITNLDRAEAFTGEPFEYQIKAENKPQAFGAFGLPQGFSCNSTTGLISGTTNSTGVFQVILSATNASGSRTKSLSLLVDLNPEISHEFVEVVGGNMTLAGTSKFVTVKNFRIGKYEVTWEEWKNVREVSNSLAYDLQNAGRGVDPGHPVSNINWFEAVKWCNLKSELEGLSPVYSYNGTTYKSGNQTNVIRNLDANGYRLPTCAEWEWAARSGNQNQNYSYSGSNNPDLVAWYDGNSGSRVQFVGTKAANQLGIHDMSGNVSEWTWDHFELFGQKQRRHYGGSFWQPKERSSVNLIGIQVPPNEGRDWTGMRLSRNAKWEN